MTCEEVRRAVAYLPLNKSPGPDKVSARILKDYLPVILGPLTEIINCSILTSTFPAKWKQAEVIPILKDCDHEEAANNRPLSLLAVAVFQASFKRATFRASLFIGVSFLKLRILIFLYLLFIT